MIFVVEQYFNTRKAKIVAWEKARDKWLADKNTGGEYAGYYTKRDYENKYPYPVIRWDRVGRVVIPSIGVTIFIAASLLLIIQPGTRNPEPKPKTSTSQEKKTNYKVGDTVQVVYGGYKDSVGSIVKVGDDDAIIKLTNSTMTKAMCSASSDCEDGGGLDNGSLLSIDSFKNLVPYKE